MAKSLKRSRSEDGPSGAQKLPREGSCPKEQCGRFLRSLGIHENFFAPAYDRCYCSHCADRQNLPETMNVADAL